MSGKGILGVSSVSLTLLLCATPAAASESAEEITTMLSWWDEVGSTWDEVGEIVDLAATEQEPCVLADNNNNTEAGKADVVQQ